VYWRPQLSQWKSWLKGPTRRDEADVALAGVTDARAVPAVCRVSGTQRAEDQKRAVGILAQIDAPSAVRALTFVAAFSVWADVRQAAMEKLVHRDAREVIDPLIAMMCGEIQFEFQPVDSSGTPGMLLVRGEKVNAQTVYIPPQRQTPEHHLSVSAARQALANDVNQIRAINRNITRMNAYVVEVLEWFTGEKLGIKAEDWRRWWASQQGYTYVLPKPATRTTTQFAAIPVFETRARLGHSCFGAGTLVSTITGDRPIESVKVGDRVLSQDTKGGALWAGRH
jgi:hypothetical protein